MEAIDVETVTPVPCQVERRAAEVRTPGDRFPDVNRLLVARTDRLGDLVLSLPAVAALCDAYPSARVGLLVREANAPLARLVSGIDQVLAAGSDVSGLCDGMKRFGADLIVCISRSATVARAAWRAGIPHRVGPANRVYSRLFTRRVDERRRSGDRHETEYALSFAHLAGATGADARFPLVLPEEATISARRWLAEHELGGQLTVLHPGSGGSCPNWPPASFLELARGFCRAGRAVVVTVGPSDGELAESIRRGTPGAPRLTLFDGSLVDLAAILSHASLVVSNSTGPLHLAAALGTPTLAIHAPWSSCGPVRWGPYAGNGWALVADHPEARRWPRRIRRAHAASLMSAISPETVLHHALSMLP